MAITSYELKDGTTRYQLQAYLGTDPATGRRVRVTRMGFKSYQEAKEAQAKLQLEHNNQGLSKDKPVRFNELYDIWLEGYRHTVKESTLRKTSEAFKLHILPELGHMFIKAISLKEAQKAVNLWYQNLVNYRMIKNYASGIMKEAMRQGLIEKNPFDLVVMPKAKKKESDDEHLNYYDKEQLQVFLEAVENQEGLKWYTFFRLLAFTGIRKGEALAITWNDIDFRKGILTISKTLTTGLDNKIIIQEPKTKTGKRTVSLDKKTLQELERWKKEQLIILQGFGHNVFKTRQLVFTTNKNDYTPLPQAGHVVNRVCKNNNLKRITVHGFRHSHCSLLFEAGLSIKEVQDRLGHSDIQTTMNIYTHVTQKRRDDVADKFAQFVSF